MVVGVVLVIVLARRDELELRERIGSAEEADFAGGVTGRGRQKVAAAPCSCDFNVEALVAFLVEERIGID